MTKQLDEKGLIHIYYGDGKGKTTAAFGLAFRCAGRGKKVLILQFLKSWETGEVMLAERIPEIEVIRSQKPIKFTSAMTEEEKKDVREQHNAFIKQAGEMISHGSYRLLVLDEIMAAWNENVVDREAVLKLLRERPENLEVAMTGRKPPRELMDMADYLSNIQNVRHPMDDKGILGREGIER